MDSHGGTNSAAAGGSYPSGDYPSPGSQTAEVPGSPMAGGGGGGGSGVGGGAN